MTEKTYKNIISGFQELSLPEMEDALKTLEGIYADKRRLADSLVIQLQALGVSVAGVTEGRPLTDRDRVRAKYRSLKNPALTWSGRGRTASWLLEEMTETGLPREAFLIER